MAQAAMEPKGYGEEIPYNAFVAMPETEQRRVLLDLQEKIVHRGKDVENTAWRKEDDSFYLRARLYNCTPGRMPVSQLDAIDDKAKRDQRAYEIYAETRGVLLDVDKAFQQDGVRPLPSQAKEEADITEGASKRAAATGSDNERQRFKDLSAEGKVAWLQQRQQKVAHWEESARFKDALSRNPDLAAKIGEFKTRDFTGMDDRALQKERKEFSEIRDALGLGHNRQNNPSRAGGHADAGRASGERSRRPDPERSAAREEGPSGFAAERREERGHGHSRGERMAQAGQRLEQFQERLSRRVERMGGMSAIQEKNPDLAGKIKQMEDMTPDRFAAMSREERREFREMRREIREDLGMGRRGRERGEAMESRQSFASEDSPNQFRGYGRDRRSHMEEGGEIFYPRTGTRGEWRVGEPSALHSQNFGPAANNTPRPDGSPVYRPENRPELDQQRDPAFTPFSGSWNG